MWIPGVNYYLYAFTASGAIFLLLWGLLFDGLDHTPLMVAGVAGAAALCSLVFIREVLMRNARERYISVKLLDKSVRQIAARTAESRLPGKLTLEGNETILRDIRKKSEAAKVLGKFPEAHQEVVTLCEEYLEIASAELANAGPGSPRIPALRKGKSVARDRHRYHMLKWAEMKARFFTHEANSREKASDKIESAQQAVNAVDHALKAYPHEASLVDSQSALRDYLTSIRVSSFIEKAERAFFKGNHKRAISLYKDALFDLKRADSGSLDLEIAAKKIDSEISRIKQLENAPGLVRDKAL